MIALECADHAVRGLAYGFALALLVDYGLYQVMGISFEGFGIALPWGHIALSVALIVAVLAASTVYALRKSHAMNLVDSLWGAKKTRRLGPERRQSTVHAKNPAPLGNLELHPRIWTKK